MTVNHHRHIPVLRFAQASYKKAILQHPSRKILANVVRVALPSMAVLASERTERDEGIIKLVLFFFRNLAMIEHPMPTETDTGEEISRSSTILALESQNVLHLLLAMSSEMGSEFNTQDVVVMEVIYHIVKCVDIEKLFMSDQEESQRLAQDLTSLLRMEDDMKRSGARSASTRHNRFGTTVWMEREVGNLRIPWIDIDCINLLCRTADGRLFLGRVLYWGRQLAFKKWTRRRNGGSLLAQIPKAYPERYSTWK
jgi:replication fork protection complex subunit Tof1/Swi1